MKIYIAGFYDTRKRLYPYRDALEAAGHVITSHWLREAPDAAYATVTEGYRTACGLEDIGDVKAAELFILDTIDVTPRGGREFEAGFALAHGIPIILVGPMRNVFHRLVWRHFETWEEALTFLKDVKRTLCNKASSQTLS
mgnify:FL=1